MSVGVGSEPGTNGQITVTLSEVASTATEFAYTLSGSATNGEDYTLVPLVGTIPAGQTTALVNIAVVDDALVEATESVVFHLVPNLVSGDTEITVVPGAVQTISITDDDSALATITSTTATASEPATPGGSSTDGRFTVWLDRASATPTTISYQVSGTAGSGTDYVALTGEVTIAAFATSSTIDVTVNHDTLLEPNETVIVTLDTVTLGDPDITVDATAATVTITDDSVVTASVNAVAATRVESDGTATFEVALTDPSATDTVLSYVLTGDAISGDDYTAPSGTVTIPSGDTSALVTITLIDDNLVEGSETLGIRLDAVPISANPNITVDTSPVETTIDDNDLSQLSLIGVADATEPASHGAFAAMLTVPSDSDTTVGYSISGDATPGADFNNLIGSVTIPAGSLTANIAVTLIDDQTLEDVETLTLTLDGTLTSGHPTITPQTAPASIAIFDDDQSVATVTPTIAAAHEPTTDGQFTVVLSNVSDSPTTITYNVLGTATAGEDFAALSGIVTIPALASMASIAVPVIDDDELEANETVVIVLDQVTAGDEDVSVEHTSATVTISDDDTASLSVTASVANAAEPATSAEFLFALTHTSDSDTEIAYSVAGDAVSGVDFVPLNGSITIPAHQLTATAEVVVNNDMILEDTELLTLTLAPTITAGDSDISVNAGSAQVSIADDDAATARVVPILSNAVEGTSDGQFEVSLTNLSDSDTVLNYIVSGTAGADVDYVGLSGSVTIPANTAATTIDVQVIDDAIVEELEHVVLELTSVATGDANIAIDTTPATVTISDTDAASVSLSSSIGSIAEGGGGGTFVVSLSSESDQDTTVSYSVSGDATSGLDFASFSGAVTIPAGQQTAPIGVTILDDDLLEDAETITLTLQSVTSGDPDVTIDGANATDSVTVTDNDTAALTVVASVSDAAEPATNGQYTLLLSQASDTDTTIGYSLGGTATASDDYVASGFSGSVTIGAGTLSATIALPVVDDDILESSETVVLTLDSVISSGDAQITVGASSTATITISDEDTATASVLATSSEAAEGGASGGFTVSLTHASDQDTTFSYQLSGAATSGSDYQAIPGTIVIPAGDTSVQVPVTVIDDGVLEPSEEVTLTLVSPLLSGDGEVTVNTNAATVTISDNDSGTIGLTSLADGMEGGGPARFEVSLSALSSTATTVSYTVSGSATSGSDFEALTGSLTIPANTASSEITVTVLDDVVLESTEDVTLTLTDITSGSTAYSLDIASQSATVLLD